MPLYWHFLKKNKFLLRKVTQGQGGFSDKRERHHFQSVLIICRVNDKTDRSSKCMHETGHGELNLGLHISSWPGWYRSGVSCMYNWMLTVTPVRKILVLDQGQHTCLDVKNVTFEFLFHTKHCGDVKAVLSKIKNKYPVCWCIHYSVSS